MEQLRLRTSQKLPLPFEALCISLRNVYTPAIPYRTGSSPSTSRILCERLDTPVQIYWDQQMSHLGVRDANLNNAAIHSLPTPEAVLTCIIA